MAKSAVKKDLISDLNEKAVRQLVQAHRRRREEPLVLAIRYHIDDPNGDIYMLEVLKNFPGADDDELLETEFGPSANLVTVGKLHLALGSPAQVQSAAKRRDPIMNAVTKGEVVFEDKSKKAAALKREIGL